MIRIRALHGTFSLLARDRVAQAREIFRASFPDLAAYADDIPSLLNDPVGTGYKAVLLVAENASARVDAFAITLVYPEARCAFLDFIAVRPGTRGSGIGGALYEAVRESAAQRGATALYLEVQPDDEALTPGAAELAEAKKRVRFYEQYGVRVIDGTAYSEPVGDPPTVALLLYDGLGNEAPLSSADARKGVRAILSSRFGHVTSPEYIDRVTASFTDDPVRLRPLRYIKPEKAEPKIESRRVESDFAIVFTQKHEIHHVRERGYFERPIRVDSIRDVVAQLGFFSQLAPREHGEGPITAVHDADFVHYLQNVCGQLKEGRPVYPDTFPIRRADKRPKALPVQAGYYCIDTGTPLYRNAYVGARLAVDSALTAVDEILAGRRVAYAACRPPGHHAGKRFYGGFCYFNNAAIAAQRIARDARVAILDIDFHHGNGTQDIFYDRDDVLTLSIHGNPDYAYPYFSGYENETGEGKGFGFNRNFPLPPGTEEKKYLRALELALAQVKQFGAEILIVGLGFDILHGDPTGTFALRPSSMKAIGSTLAATGLPLLVIQEGGYNVRNIRRGCAEFFRGCMKTG